MSNRIYAQTIQAKDGTIIPQLINGKTIDSRYNPQAEALRNFSAINNENYFIILGIGAGLLIRKILSEKSGCFILAIENSLEDLAFLKANCFIEDKKNFKATTIENFSEDFINTYVPAFYGEYKIFENKAWCNENPENAVIFKTLFEKSFQVISADYSAQCHFGKIWTKNIFNNLKYINKSISKINITKKDKAAVIAAGPTFDTTVKNLNPANTTIISTDTAFPVLIKKEIIPDFVVSLDGQFISSEHFRINEMDFSRITFVLDISCNPSTVNYIIQKKGNIIFSTSANPLSQLINKAYPDSFIPLYSGTGTVTISALDFAVNTGFKEIEIYGADFAYSKGKSYTTGTYLDTLYSIDSNKLKTSEKIFDRLLFRTELIAIDKDKQTSAVLDSYRKGLDLYLQKKNISCKKINDIYFLHNTKNKAENLSFNNNYDFNHFYKQYFTQLSSKKSPKNTIFDLSAEEISLLPLISWLRKSDTKIRSFNDYLKLAIDFIQDI